MNAPADRDQAIADKLRGEIYDRAERQANAVFGGTPSDGTDLSKPKYLEYVRRNLRYPEFVQSLLTEIGPEQFRLDLAEAVGADPDVVWPLPPGGPNG